MIITEHELESEVVREEFWDAAFVVLQKENGEDWIYKSRSSDISSDKKLSFASFLSMLKTNRVWYK
jgi:hypothetical protein